MIIRKATDKDMYDIVRLLIKAFSHNLAFLGNDPAAVLSSSLRTAGFFVAEQERIIGVVALSSNQARAIQIDKRAMRSSLGFIKGTVLSYMAEKALRPKVALTDSGAFIDAVAVDEEFRGRGVAAQMLKHIISQRQYGTYYLEVLDSNDAAINCYQKCGFRELLRKRARVAKSYKYKIIMECRSI